MTGRGAPSTGDCSLVKWAGGGGAGHGADQRWDLITVMRFGV